MLYFLINKDSLSVYQKISPKKSLSLVEKAKFHSKLDSLLGNPKKLSSVIARALDEISEKIIFANKTAAITIDDSLIYHSLTIKSKKFQNVESQIEEENKNKWSEKSSEFYFAAESRKGSKNIFHSVNINHFLREKIKLNFNNFGIRVAYFVPISSILNSKIKSSQYAVRKIGTIYHIFGFNKKSFSHVEVSFSGKKKGIKNIINLNRPQKFKEDDLVKNNLKFIHFNTTKILEFFSNIVENKDPILNFASFSGLQILDGDLVDKRIQKTFKKQKTDYSYFKTAVAAVTSFFVLVFILNTLSDYKFMNFEENVNYPEIELNDIKPLELNFTEKSQLKSLIILNDFSMSIKRNDSLKKSSITVDENSINNNSKNETLFDNLDITNTIDMSLLISSFYEIDNELKYKIFDGNFLGKPSKNIVLRFNSLSNYESISNKLSSYKNVFVRKVTFSSELNHLHIYISLSKI